MASRLLHLSQFSVLLPISSVTFDMGPERKSLPHFYIITEKHGSAGCNVGEEGGFDPNTSSFTHGLDLTKEAIDRAGYNDRIKLATDVAATDFCVGDD
ncbi:hypothetical protein AAC387_Pa03g1907 [Persea americana]